jgi:hypothetical protein
VEIGVCGIGASTDGLTRLGEMLANGSISARIHLRAELDDASSILQQLHRGALDGKTVFTLGRKTNDDKRYGAKIYLEKVKDSPDPLGSQLSVYFEYSYTCNKSVLAVTDTINRGGIVKSKVGDES